jgi:hypothetical protein
MARASCRAILERYTHREFEELSAAVEALPALGGAGGDGVPALARAAADPPISGASPPATSTVHGTAGSTPPDEGG